MSMDKKRDLPQQNVIKLMQELPLPPNARRKIYEKLSDWSRPLQHSVKSEKGLDKRSVCSKDHLKRSRSFNANLPAPAPSISYNTEEDEVFASFKRRKS